jgi:hypothetical protein
MAPKLKTNRYPELDLSETTSAATSYIVPGEVRETDIPQKEIPKESQPFLVAAIALSHQTKILTLITGDHQRRSIY